MNDFKSRFLASTAPKAKGARSHRVFDLALLPRDNRITRHDTPEGRFYNTPVGMLPSVTSVIDKRLDNVWLEKWIARVGEKEAERVKKRAAERGTILHKACEEYILNTKEYDMGLDFTDLERFRLVQKHIDENVGKVYGVEYPLWSSVLKSAGTSDFLCEWDFEDAIVDFKTSTREKTEKNIEGYRIQVAAYTIMANERFEEMGLKLRIKRNVMTIVS